MKIAVLGCSSFGGSWLVRLGLDLGYSIIGFSRSELRSTPLCAFENNRNKKNFFFVKADLNKDLDLVIDQLKAAQPDYIVDFAGQGMVAPSWITPEDWYETNLLSKVRMIGRLQYEPWLQGYIKISTPEVYGSTTGALSESVIYNPSTPYAISHAAIDQHMLAYHKERQFPVIFGRFANFYGEHQQLYRIIPKAFFCAMNDDKLSLDGGGYSVRSFIHASDVAQAVMSMISSGKTGEIYHFASDQYISIRSLVKNIAEITQVQWERFVEDAPERIGKDAIYQLDCHKARTELGWRAKISLNEGLLRTWEWIQRDATRIKNLETIYVHKA